MSTSSPDAKALLFDLDGVFYIDETLIDGAADALDDVRRRGMPYRFITNTSTRTAAQIGDKLRTLGLDVEDDEIFSAVTATVDWLASRGHRRMLPIVDPAVLPAFGAFEQTRGDDVTDAVVIGDIGERWDYALLDRIFQQVMQGAALVAMHRNRYWRSGSGLRLDIGAFVAGLEYAAGVSATVCGKPNPTFFEMACAAMQTPTGQVAVVGDDIDSDIGGAQSAGLVGVLVRTGKFTERTLSASAVQPDAVIDSIAALPAWLKGSADH